MLRFNRLLLPLLILLLPALASHAAAVKTGAQVAAEDGFSVLKGKKFGLVTNATAMVEGRHLLDLMIASGTAPSVIFGPEHGLKGKTEDGVRIADASEDDIPVLSLYGDRKKPRLGDLAGLDLLVFDIQDIGARFYTFISTMGLAMQGAAEAGIPFVVLDRPNPLGGNYVSGFVRESGLSSFTSLFPVPIAHGMTVGELARMVKGESMLPGLDRLELTVVRMEGWRRSMRWPDTGLPWVPTSPNIPDYETSLLYAGVGLLEATSASEGRGTREPFKLAGAPALDGPTLAGRLNALALPGVRFEPAAFSPTAIPGMSSHPKFKDRPVAGVRIEITDQSVLLPVETGVSVMAAIYESLSEAEKKTFFRKGIDLMAGTDLLQRSLELRRSPDEIQDLWLAEVEAFRESRERYLLYSR
jgi:uncharacterized protein YbbC (DUF1343 family)